VEANHTLSLELLLPARSGEAASAAAAGERGAAYCERAYSHVGMSYASLDHCGGKPHLVPGAAAPREERGGGERSGGRGERGAAYCERAYSHVGMSYGEHRRSYRE
jgi:hypothetical protein